MSVTLYYVILLALGLFALIYFVLTSNRNKYFLAISCILYLFVVENSILAFLHKPVDVKLKIDEMREGRVIQKSFLIHSMDEFFGIFSSCDSRFRSTNDTGNLWPSISRSADSENYDQKDLLVKYKNVSTYDLGRTDAFWDKGCGVRSSVTQVISSKKFLTEGEVQLTFLSDIPEGINSMEFKIIATGFSENYPPWVSFSSLAILAMYTICFLQLRSSKI